METKKCFLCGDETNGAVVSSENVCDDCRENQSLQCSECGDYFFPKDGLLHRKKGSNECFCCHGCFQSLTDYDEIQFPGDNKWVSIAELDNMWLTRVEKITL